MKIEFDDLYLAQLWDNYDWVQAEKNLASLQRALTKAAYAYDEKRIMDIQKRIVRLLDAKALAVRHVAASGSGPGIDNIRWVESADKMRAALSLTSKDYHAKPMVDVIIHSKSTGKERRIGIPTYYDRAMQVLYDYSLAPVTEAWADRKSFSFRPGRSLQDANAYILKALMGSDAPEYVAIGDVQAFYASIQRSWLLKHTPMDKKVLYEFLRCGHIFAGELFPTEEIGISPGANLSPRLANFVLDGMQKFLYDHMYEDKIDYSNGNLIRCADDIFVTVRTKEDGEKVLSLISEFLAVRGLQLSPQKSKIQNIKDGVTFLSRTYIKKNGLIYVYPSRQAIDRCIEELRELILTHNKSQRDLINRVNRKLTGWAGYHRYTDAYEAFREIDTAVQTFLLEAAAAKHPRLAKQKVINRYWYETGAGKHIYALPNQREIYIMSLADVMLAEHRKITTNKNPYLDSDYFEGRSHEQEIQNVTARYRPIWKRQGGKCYYCGRPILQDQPRTLVDIDLKKPSSFANWAYVHTICSTNEVNIHYISDDLTTVTGADIQQILNKVEKQTERVMGRKGKQEIGDNWKHIKLKHFFSSSNAPSVTLTFSQIEKIDGRPMAKGAYSSMNYWYRRNNCNMIAEAWLTEGYTLEAINFEKQKATFHRVAEGISHVEMPKWLLTEKIPDDAKYELEKFFEYIGKKYGL